MKDFSYNVLWIDDQWDDKEKGNYPFILNAKTKGIDIEAYKTSKEGMKAFEASLYKWDGIILDAKCFRESEYEVPDTKGMYNSIYRIKELTLKRFVPMYIYTGQADLLSDKHFINSLEGKKPYIKGTDNDKLLADIIEAAKELEETQIRRDYWDIFEAYPELEKDLIVILKRANNIKNNDTEVFVTIRKVLELIKPILIKLLLGSNNDIPHLNNVKRYIAADKSLPKSFTQSLYSCIEIVNTLAHEKNEELSDEEYQKIRKTIEEKEMTPYLIRSTIFELLNILYYLKKIICSYSREQNIECLQPSNIQEEKIPMSGTIRTLKGMLYRREKEENKKRFYIELTDDSRLNQEDNGKGVSISYTRR